MTAKTRPTPDQPTKTPWTPTLGLLLASLAALVLLVGLSIAQKNLYIFVDTTSETTAWALAPIAPFARWDLLVVTCLVCLPSSWFSGVSLAYWFPAPAWLGLVFGLGSVGTSILIAPSLEAWTHSSGVTGHIVSGLLWCLAIQLPWCFWAIRHFLPRPKRLPWTGLGLSIAVWLIAVMYAERCAKDTAQTVAKAIQEYQLVEAMRQADTLARMGGDSVPGPAGQPSVRLSPLRQELKTELEQLRQQTRRPLGKQANVRACVNRAQQFLMLEQWAEAIAVLTQPACRGTAEAQRVLASVYQRQQNWPASEAAFVQVYQQAKATLQAAPQDVATAHALLASSPSGLFTAGRWPAYQQIALQQALQCVAGRAFNAREQHQFHHAEQIYIDAFDDLPRSCHAQLHFDLARHYNLADRPLLAMDHAQQAAEADPRRLGSSAAALMRQLQEGTPGCLIGGSALPRR